MKNIAVVLGAFLTLFIVSCEGDPGPPGLDGLPGPQGPQGEDGVQAQVFEVEGVNFEYNNANNLYETFLPFGDFTSFEVLPNDAVLVYQFGGTAEFDNGNEENVWNQIPQTYFLEQGSIQYLPGHTTKDVEILITGNFDLSTLDSGFTTDQIFRVVIVPGVAAEAKLDKSDLNAVMGSLGVTEKDVQKVQFD